MVHALSDACRVTTVAGLIIDLRPLPDVRPLHLVSGSGAVEVARVATTGRSAEDEAADRAVARFVRDGGLKERSRSVFEVEIYADTAEEFAGFAATRRSMHVAPSGAELQWACRRALAGSAGGGRLRYRRGL